MATRAIENVPTDDQAVRLARLLADQEGYPWQGPVSVSKQKQFIVFGRRFWRVVTNANRPGPKLHFRIEQRTGRVVMRYAPR